MRTLLKSLSQHPSKVESGGPPHNSYFEGNWPQRLGASVEPGVAGLHRKD